MSGAGNHHADPLPDLKLPPRIEVDPEDLAA